MLENTWYSVDDIFEKDTLLNIEEGKRYAVCVENCSSNDWVPIFAYYYKAGSEVDLVDPNDVVYNHKIKKDGFYVINECGKDRFTSIFRLEEARFFADIRLPQTKPDEIITIEK